MKKEVLNLTYASSLTNLCELNSSFDSGILRIAYHGDNRNGSSISKDVFEKCLGSIYNCPVVCNYDVETDTIGGHDIEFVHGDDGSMRLINVTHPVGVIPESAKTFWEVVEENDGTMHEYLCVETLIWKRQAAYKKIKEDNITAQSMEITVKDGQSVNGIYHINDFEFTAFALLGNCEPCFESASLAFSINNFKQQISEMMLELKECIKIATSCGDDDIYQTKYSMEGGETVLDKKELIAKYNIDIDNLDFSIDEFTVEELEEMFKKMGDAKEGNLDNEPDKFALTSNIVDEIYRSLDGVKVEHEWGEYPRYCYVDCDFDDMEVYCWDTADWLLYGFSYKLNGDNIDIDFESKKRKKYVIADFNEGEQESPFAQVFDKMEQKLRDNADLVDKYHAASDTITSMEKELGELRQYKSDVENAIARGERDEVFAQFGDLVGVEAFEELKENCMEYSTDVIEEKCYAIRGRQSVPSKFSVEQKTPKIKIQNQKENKEEPYGGLFEKYGFSKNE